MPGVGGGNRGRVGSEEPGGRGQGLGVIRPGVREGGGAGVPAGVGGKCLEGMSPGRSAGRGGRDRDGAGRARGQGGSGEGAGPGLPQLGRPRSWAHGAERTARGLRTKGPRRLRGHRRARIPTLAQPRPGPLPGRGTPAEPKNVGRPARPAAVALASAALAAGRRVRCAPGPVSCSGRRRRLAVFSGRGSRGSAQRGAATWPRLHSLRAPGGT